MLVVAAQKIRGIRPAEIEGVAVTGAAGLIGSAVVRQFALSGVSVTAIDLPGAPDKVPGTSVPVVHADIAGPTFEKILDSYRPRAIIHAAAHPGGKSLRESVEDVRVNALGSMRVFDWCAKTGSHVVYLSSSVVYGEQPEGPISEGATLQPGTIYGVAKVACEQWLRILGNGRGLNWTVLRLFATYGAGHQLSLEQGIVNIMLTQLLSGNRIVVKGSLQRQRDMIYVDDVATVIVQSVLCPEAKGQVVNVGTGVSVTIGEMINTLCDVLARPRSAVEIVEEEGTLGDPFSNVADISRLKEIIAFEPRFDLTAGVQELVRARLMSTP